MTDTVSTTQPADEATTDLAAFFAAHAILPHCVCACGAEHDRRGTGESGEAWHARHVAEALAPYVRQQRAAAWDEGQAAAGADYMRGYDANLEGLPCPPPTPNPYRAEAERRGEPA